MDPDANASPYSEGVVSGNLFFRDGTRYTILAGLVTAMNDRHGNKIAFNYENQNTLGTPNDGNIHRLTNITDSLGRIVSIEYNNFYDAFTFEFCDTLTYNPKNGS